MNLKNFLNDRIQKMDWLDMALVKWSCMLFGILLVLLFPNLLNFSVKAITIWIIIFAARPIYRYFK